MTESKDLAESALAILKGWHWGHCDPDGFQTHYTSAANDVLNRLAFSGHDDPSNAILRLLCDDKLTAICNYQWLKFKHHKTFKASNTVESIDPAKWQNLAKLLSEVKWGGEEDDWGKLKISLPELDLNDCLPAEWCPEYNRCSFALCSTGIQSYEEGYFEEWFEATNIEIGLSSSLMANLRRPGDADDHEEPNKSKSTGQMPPLSEAELMKWWKSKASVRDSLSQDELVALAQLKYPDNHISRDRIRDLTGSRKRGPKPLSGKTSAK